MKIPIFQVDAFTSDIFKGNPAAVCPLNEWLPDKMMQNISIPSIHIAESTAQFITNDEYKKPALLATKFTMEEDFYVHKLKDYGLDPVIPIDESRNILHSVIYDELCFNITSEKSRNKFLDIVQEVEQEGADSVILGCTEVGMLLNEDNVSIPVYDTVELHCKSIFRSIL